MLKDAVSTGLKANVAVSIAYFLNYGMPAH